MPPEREEILQRDRARKAMRQSLMADIEQAKVDLHPRTIGARWTAKQKARVVKTGEAAKQNITKNAPLVGIAGLAVLLFAARRPISDWIQRLRTGAPNDEGDEE
jgi:hypothetical protein